MKITPWKPSWPHRQNGFLCIAFDGMSNPQIRIPWSLQKTYQITLSVVAESNKTLRTIFYCELFSPEINEVGITTCGKVVKNVDRDQRKNEKAKRQENAFYSGSISKTRVTRVWLRLLQKPPTKVINKKKTYGMKVVVATSRKDRHQLREPVKRIILTLSAIDTTSAELWSRLDDKYEVPVPRKQRHWAIKAYQLTDFSFERKLIDYFALKRTVNSPWQ